MALATMKGAACGLWIRRCRWIGGRALVGAVLLCARPSIAASRARLRISTRRFITLRGALPRAWQVALLPGGGFAVLSGTFTGNDSLLGIFTRSGVLVKNLAGTSVPAGLGSLTSVYVDGRGDLWVGALMPPEVAQFTRNGLVSVRLVPKLKIEYSLALDEARRYLYVAGCDPEGPGGNVSCLLVHQFTADGLKLRKSFLQMDPSIVRNMQVTMQSVDIDVDGVGTVWAVDSPALVLYKINPASGHVSRYAIRSQIARPPGKLIQSGDPRYFGSYIRSLFLPTAVIACGDWVAVCVRRAGDSATAGYFLEIFKSSSEQVGEDVAAPGELVGKGSGDTLLFSKPGKHGPILIEAVIPGSR
jgi:hypothetical protein